MVIKRQQYTVSIADGSYYCGFLQTVADLYSNKLRITLKSEHMFWAGDAPPPVSQCPQTYTGLVMSTDGITYSSCGHNT